MISKFFLLIFFSCLAQICFTQVQFSNRNDLLAERDMHSAVPVGIADMNGDGLDDIVTLNFGTRLFIQYQTPDTSRPFVRYEAPVTIDIDAQNDICIADFNNDGTNDILTVGSYDRVKVLYGIPFTYGFDLTHITVFPFFSQGASAGDFNGDGWVDVVLLNDNGLNYTLMNDGAGNLVSEDFFNFVTEPTSDNSGNYGSVYTDFDMDGDNDFYIAKCRQGVNSPNDPRRINVLFVNDGNNNYTQDAASYGLASGRQTWTTDFGDIDNDGDLDAFMTQHDVISELFENIDNDTFINITSEAGLNIGGIPLQGMFRDFDNDGFQDILVSGDRIDYYHNNGDKTFTKENPFGTIVFGTYALGDLNADGFTDVYASRVIPFNNPDQFREDILFFNQPNDNHFLSLKLIDPAENASAIGAMAILYGKWGIQIREVRGGEQYGVSNGHTMIFGLGEETTFDSLIIRWPDGERQNFNDLNIDESWTLRRDGCFSLSEKKWPALNAICGLDSVILFIDTTADFVRWSTGSQLDSIIVKEAGLYFVEYIDASDCLIRTLPVEVIKDPDSIMPFIIYEGNLELCNFDEAVLSLSSAQGYVWSTGETQQSIVVTQSGDYFAQVQGYCLTLLSDTISLDFLVPEAPVIQHDTFATGEPAVLFAAGDSIVWYDSSGATIIGTGPQLVLNNLTTSTTFFAQNLLPIEGEEFGLGPLTQQGSTKYNASFVNGGLLFEVYDPIILEEFSVFTDSAGPRIIEISNGIDFFYQHPIDLTPGKTVIPLNVQLPAGSYTLSTNTDVNILEYGDASPFLWRSSAGVSYPYEINGIVAITGSNYGEQYYYYFYDWKIATSDRYCGSDLVAATAVLDLEVSIPSPPNLNVLNIHPNPTSNNITVSMDLKGPATLELMDLNGEIMKREKFSSNLDQITMDLTQMPSGVYIVILYAVDGQVTKKVVKL